MDMPCEKIIMKHFSNNVILNNKRGGRGHDRMVVGFTTTYAINAYHH